jgi:hypothetical protein
VGEYFTSGLFCLQRKHLTYEYFFTFFFTGRSCSPVSQPPSWRTTPCRLSATVYSIYSQLPSISEAFGEEEMGYKIITTLRPRRCSIINSLYSSARYEPFNPSSPHLQ